MGISTSRSLKHDNETVRSIKIPKHLQPLKRKQTKKRSSESVTTVINSPKINERLSNNKNRIMNCSSSQFTWSNGRKFSSEISSSKDYVTCHLPQDQHELDRQRVQSYILRWVFESRHIVPPMIKDMLLDGIRVLDVSCGPGLYVGNPFMDMAQDFHKSTFDSIDICNLMARKQEMDTIYHEEVKLSPPVGPQKLLDNFTFTPYNVVKEHRIPYPDDTFDYTQQSLVTLAYAKEDWKTVMLDLKRVTKPGGYIQLLEIDLCPQPLGDASGLWRDQVLQCFEDKRGLDIGIPKRLNQVLAEIGLIEIETRFVSVPVGSWGLDIGLLWEENLNSFLEAMRPYLVEAMQVTDEQYKKDRAAFQNELQNVKAFNNICIAWGRIPL